MTEHSPPPVVPGTSTDRPIAVQPAPVDPAVSMLDSPPVRPGYSVIRALVLIARASVPFVALAIYLWALSEGRSGRLLFWGVVLGAGFIWLFLGVLLSE